MLWGRTIIFWPISFMVATLLSCYSLQVIMGKLSITSSNTSLPDAYATDVVLVTTDRSGRIQYTVEAQQFTHYQTNHHALFNKPVITITSDHDRSPWLITSDKGEAYANNDCIRLVGHVKAKQDTTLFSTNHMTVNKKNDRAETDAHVTITTPDGTLEADGLIATLSTQYTQLLSHVKGSYVSQTLF